MAFDFGKLLQGLGTGTAQLGQTYYKGKMDMADRTRQEKLDAEKRLLDELSKRKLGLEIGGLEREQTRLPEGEAKLAEYLNSLSQYQQQQGKYDEGVAEREAHMAEVGPNLPMPEAPVKPDFSKVAPYMDQTSVDRALDYVEGQRRTDMLAKTKGDNTGGVFQEGSREYELASKIANGQITWNQGLQAFVGFGNKTGKREDLVNTIFEINPDYKSSEGEGQYRADVGEAQIPVKARTAAATGAAGTKAREGAEREIQREEPMFTGPQAIAISQSAIAVKNLQRLRQELVKGSIDYFDIERKTGQFKNPRVNNAFQQVSEIVGRSQSGAAIADHEWKNFGKEILNKNFLLSESGRKAALENLDDYIERFYSNGQLITSDPDWYKNYQSRTKGAVDGIKGDSGTSGWDEGKETRYQELLRKKREGALR